MPTTYAVLILGQGTLLIPFGECEPFDSTTEQTITSRYSHQHGRLWNSDFSRNGMGES